AKGINILVDLGVLYKKRGIGMFVSEGAKESIKKKRRESFYDNYIKAMITEAGSLGITKDEVIKMIKMNK
ncbi:MAG: GntR family transcriptional regulator, partial [Eubacteriales bacterium]|nr:GntR family transcriptional regulator [Eubacteriales bacterium]